MHGSTEVPVLCVAAQRYTQRIFFVSFISFCFEPIAHHGERNNSSSEKLVHFVVGLKTRDQETRLRQNFSHSKSRSLALDLELLLPPDRR
mmetsp:Transcript_16000/g.65812  ORF Transcript_16000/g.65812 Transcript_16000/m.65812 type:complete len:90 (+) Transcript_16000:3714-3983(+)